MGWGVAGVFTGDAAYQFRYAVGHGIPTARLQSQPTFSALFLWKKCLELEHRLGLRTICRSGWILHGLFFLIFIF